MFKAVSRGGGTPYVQSSATLSYIGDSFPCNQSLLETLGLNDQ